MPEETAGSSPQTNPRCLRLQLSKFRSKRPRNPTVRSKPWSKRKRDQVEPELTLEPEVQPLETETAAVSQPVPLDPPAQPSVVLPRPKPALEQVRDPGEEETVVAALLEETGTGSGPNATGCAGYGCSTACGHLTSD